ncbi:MAG: TonB-dependent receptor [Gammaproteobacteria bacterium]|nr:TonB-dependent receptor [Gammaproteobacteria bacterium]
MELLRLSLCSLLYSALLLVPDPASAAAPEGVDAVVVTARLREEDAQQVPIAMSVLDGDSLDLGNTTNLGQLTQLAPSTNFVSPNPRNTALTIRGLGSSVVAVAQANDGLEPGVGYYVDGVYHARPATTAFDLLDLERVEILRGPQGTLFGKNTTAGALNIVTRAPSFERELRAELSAGNYGFVQSKFSATGALLGDQLAGRLSSITTRRDGVLRNVLRERDQNDIDNAAVRGQLLYQPREDFRLRLSGDYQTIDTECCTQVFYRVGRTLKAPAPQYPALAAGQDYAPPSFDPYDRLTDIDAELAVMSHEGGAAATADWWLGKLQLTSITAWRFWDWDAANDRDYTGLPIQLRQGIPSRQDQYSQELRVSAPLGQRAQGTAGFYAFHQRIDAAPGTGYGPLAAYWLLGPPPAVPAELLDGYTSEGRSRFAATSYAVFGEASRRVLERLDLTGGVRWTEEDKHGRFNTRVFGGLATRDPALVALQRSILRPQSYRAALTDGSASGRVAAAWHWRQDFMTYASWARGFKSGGINMSGLPLDANGLPAVAFAKVRPEEVTTYELGLKSHWLDERLTLNLALFHTEVRDFQANVVDSSPGALRGYLANIDKVRVKGAELDGAFNVSPRWRLHFAAAWTDAEYARYPNSPCPLEALLSATSVCDLSGRPLPATPRWAGSGASEYFRPVRLAGLAGEAYARLEVSARSQVYGEPTDSRFGIIKGYGLVNVVVGLRQQGPWDLSFWVRNLFADDYMQNITVQAGNSGLVVGTPSDPRTYGMTLRLRL